MLHGCICFFITCNEYLPFTILAGTMTWVQRLPKSSSRVTGLGCSSLTSGGVCCMLLRIHLMSAHGFVICAARLFDHMHLITFSSHQG